MEPEAEQPQEAPLSCLIAALTRLMTHYALRPNADNARAVVRILRALNSHPEARVQPMLQNAWGRMLPYWQDLAANRQQQAASHSLYKGPLH
ncbi:MAG: hypothetical protein U5P41_11060 [Gammaproteobacteria bacterium]|nr:hypothetical protein [Gammaproteobacteria bacterium]